MSKANDLLKEFLNEKFEKPEKNNLNPQELVWGSKLGLQFSEDETQFQTTKNWHIRFAEGNFHIWLNNCDSSSLFFDGTAIRELLGLGCHQECEWLHRE